MDRCSRGGEGFLEPRFRMPRECILSSPSFQVEEKGREAAGGGSDEANLSAEQCETKADPRFFGAVQNQEWTQGPAAEAGQGQNTPGGEIEWIKEETVARHLLSCPQPFLVLFGWGGNESMSGIASRALGLHCASSSSEPSQAIAKAGAVSCLLPGGKALFQPQLHLLCQAPQPRWDRSPSGDHSDEKSGQGGGSDPAEAVDQGSLPPEQGYLSGGRRGYRGRGQEEHRQ